MNLNVKNFFAFNNFEICFSYPKKIVNSGILHEHLPDRENFRFKKVNVLMGANASGKTSLGKALLSIFSFLTNKELKHLNQHIRNRKMSSSFSIDFVLRENILYRVFCEFSENSVLNLEIYSSVILKKDSYESAVKRLSLIEGFNREDHFTKKLEFIENFGWLFTFSDSEGKHLLLEDSSTLKVDVLEKVLLALDSNILSVKRSKEINSNYIVEVREQEPIIISEGGEIFDRGILSSGTKTGLEIAFIISSLLKNYSNFYYCDEKFSFIQSDIEKNIFSLMIELLHPRDQLFFTTHNLDILDMKLPRHSFHFLRKIEEIEVIDPSKILIRNNQSLRNAVRNDVFNISPDINFIDDILEMRENE